MEGFPYISRIRTAFIGEDSEPFEVPNEMFGDLSSEMFSTKRNWLAIEKLTVTILKLRNILHP